MGIPYLYEALDIATDIGDKKKQAEVITSMGIVFSNLAEFDSAQIYYLRALDIRKEKGERKEQADVLRNLGNNAGRSNNMDKALAYYEQGVQIMRELGQKSEEAALYNMMGYAWTVKGYYPKALEYNQAALKLMEADENKIGIADCCNRISDIYLSLEDYPQALSFIERAYAIWEEMGEGTQQSDLLYRKGYIYRLKEDYRPALQFMKESFALKKAIGQAVSSKHYYDLGYCYGKLEHLDSALFFLQLALSSARETNNPFDKANSLIELANIHFQKGDTETAIAELDEATELAIASGNKEQEMEAAEALYLIYKSRNNTGKALYYHETYRNLQDSLFNEKNIREIGHMEAKYEFDNERQQLAFEREKELARQRSMRRLYLIALGVALLFSGVLFRYYHSKQRANAELSKLNEKILHQKEELEELDIAKSRFFTNISHEFRTPLAIISGMAGQIIKNPQEWAVKGGQMIKQNSANLLNLVNQILDLRKLEAKELKLNMVQGDVVKYLRYLAESYEPYARSKGLQLHFLPAIEKLDMDFDPEKLLRIVSNLLSNAVKFTPDNGHVYFHLNQSVENGQPFLQLRVEDTGAGIAADQLPHIFDRFFQVDDSATRKGEGTGIGLALAKELAHLMKGGIDVKSTLGKGTIFTVSLPVTNDSPVREVSVAQPDSPPLISLAAHHAEGSGRQAAELPTAELKAEDLPTLLIVEDNPDIRQFLVACLENDYQLETAANGREGIGLALEIVPDLIISDVMMPEKDGFELCETLKNDERTSHIPIILLTAKADMESRISGLKKGADAYLSKPFEQEELMVRLEKLFELRQKLQARYRSLQPEAAPENKEDEFVQKVRQAVLANLSDETFGVAQLCRTVALGRAQLHNKLKALTGQPTSHFVRSIRLQKAKELLESSGLNVSEVGYEVGFKNPSHFSTAYQEEFGAPPSKTRK
ncbi:MAG: response regulator [Lewinellaceae bacterium]|nr:response regulator [Lewinellaceae bacterium]